MPAGITVNGSDLDDIFKGRTSTKRADVGFQVAGSDISNRYEPAGTTANSKISFDTGFVAASTDLKELFMRKGYNPFDLTLNFTVVQSSGDVWEVYISGPLSLSCRINYRRNGNRSTNFNPADAASNYRKIFEVDTGTPTLYLDTIDFYNTNGTLFNTYGIGKSFYTGSNINGLTTAVFTIGNSTQSNLGTYALASNTKAFNKATAVFTVRFTSINERS
jgi:hypothetical protein